MSTITVNPQTQQQPSHSPIETSSSIGILGGIIRFFEMLFSVIASAISAIFSSNANPQRKERSVVVAQRTAHPTADEKLEGTEEKLKMIRNLENADEALQMVHKGVILKPKSSATLPDGVLPASCYKPSFSSRPLPPIVYSA